MDRKLLIMHTHINPTTPLTASAAAPASAAAAPALSPACNAFAFATVHLESLEPYVNTRIAQLSLCTDAITHAAHTLTAAAELKQHSAASAIGSVAAACNVVLCGDMNFACEAADAHSHSHSQPQQALSKEEHHLRASGWRDVWRTLHSDAGVAAQQALGHSMVTYGRGGWRPDRVLIGPSATDIKPISIQLFGNQPMRMPPLNE